MRIVETLAVLVAAAAIILAVAFVFLTASIPHAQAAGVCDRVVASWYGAESGSRTANGEHFTGNALTAAHRSLPFNTKLRVTYKSKSLVVRINDRGPYIKGRSLDLSRAAAARIGMIGAGVAAVQVCRV